MKILMSCKKTFDLKTKLGDTFLQNNLVMFIAVSLTNLVAFFYQLYIVRTLTPVEFGLFNSYLALLVVFSITGGTIQTATADFLSRFRASGLLEEGGHFLTVVAQRAFLVGVAIFLVIFLLKERFVVFLNAESTVPVILVGITFFLYLLLPVSKGALQGLHRFVHLGTVMVIDSVLRLAMGIFLVSLGLGVLGAIAGFTIATFIALFISFVLLQQTIKKLAPAEIRNIGMATEGTNPGQVDPSLRLHQFYTYLLPVTITLLCFMLMTNIDVVLVRHYFPALEAGYYSIAQLVGKIVLFAPAAVSLVMFPTVSDSQARNKPSGDILRKSIYIVMVLCFPLALFSLIKPSLMLNIITGKVYPECIPLVRMFAIIMPLFALVNLFLYYHLSRHNFRVIYFLVVLTLIEIALIVLFHKTLLSVLLILGFTALTLLVFNISTLNGHFNFGSHS